MVIAIGSTWRKSRRRRLAQRRDFSTGKIRRTLLHDGPQYRFCFLTCSICFAGGLRFVPELMVRTREGHHVHQ